MADEKLVEGMVNMVLRLAGISKLRVRLDCSTRALEADYVQGGSHQVRTIPFSELEKMFSQTEESPAEPTAEPATPLAAP